MSQGSNQVASASNGRRQYQARTPETSRIVSRPTPQGPKGDVHAFQLNQVRRRYSPAESTGANGEALLKLRLVPSDPDFPFDLQGLDCTIVVPKSFPAHKHSLRVTNKDMGRGYQINIEHGFDAIVTRLASSTILQHLYALDRELETLLAAPKAETVKIVVHAPERDVRQKPDTRATHSATIDKNADQTQEGTTKPTYTSQQLDEARAIRQYQIRQLEARLGRTPLFNKDRDGVTYTIPVEPKRAELPATIRDVQSIRIIVPELYNLEPCRIELTGHTSLEASSVEQNFQTLSNAKPEMTLFALVNKLSQTMHLMAKPAVKTQPIDIASQLQTKPASLNSTHHDPVQHSAKSVSDMDIRSHVIVIPRPPEWSAPHDDASDSEEDSSWDELSYSEDETGSEKEGLNPIRETAHRPERGILISFPNLELIGIELMELITLSITVKCDRCKDITDVPKLSDSASNVAAVKVVACKKCANQLSIGYRMDLLHANCIRAGYLDLDGCTVVDMLTSFFKPTCAQCSTPYPLPGVPSVRGDVALAICRECHKQMNFKIPEIKFLLVSAAAVRASQAPRKKKETLGIRAGEQLPNRGRCSHYAKSYRWFRFSCCSKVFPCDRCHDAAESHPNEHANRMICGHCSREQNYRPEDCAICHASLTAKKGTGFWEGGKGTRDKTRMSRKDPRKYKRRPGTAPRAGAQ